MSSPVDEPAREALAGLSRVAEPGNAELARLVERLGPAEVWAGVRRGRLPLAGAELAALRVRLADARPARDLERVRALGGRLVCPGDPEWPAHLADLDHTGYVRPLALWVRGPVRLAEVAPEAVAVVGARACTPYGTALASELAGALVDARRAVVSGGAYGVDGAAHRGALMAGGVTLAVLACGLDVAYPRGHAALFERIAADGALVSEWPPGCAPMRHRFLVRNRVIAALSAGTVVVEADLRSGALSTAGYAEMLSRPVMAVPGPVGAATSAGCHRLIRERNAALATGPSDVLELVGGLGRLPLPLEPPAGPRLSRSARRVLDAVPLRRAAGTDRIAAVAGLGGRDVLAGLGELLSAGLVQRTAAGWRRARDVRPIAPVPPGAR